mmetsp:Transcript_32783/g.93015  ORF Transcript_32783/g.93015 Transcript_32783/m.93015 type:complete len:281 (-) Transcript_32783:47-889(-)
MTLETIPQRWYRDGPSMQQQLHPIVIQTWKLCLPLSPFGVPPPRLAQMRRKCGDAKGCHKSRRIAFHGLMSMCRAGRSHWLWSLSRFLSAASCPCASSSSDTALSAIALTAAAYIRCSFASSCATASILSWIIFLFSSVSSSIRMQTSSFRRNASSSTPFAWVSMSSASLTAASARTCSSSTFMDAAADVRLSAKRSIAALSTSESSPQSRANVRVLGRRWGARQLCPAEPCRCNSFGMAAVECSHGERPTLPWINLTAQSPADVRDAIRWSAARRPRMF